MKKNISPSDIFYRGGEMAASRFARYNRLSVWNNDCLEMAIKKYSELVDLYVAKRFAALAANSKNN